MLSLAVGFRGYPDEKLTETPNNESTTGTLFDTILGESKVMERMVK